MLDVYENLMIGKGYFGILCNEVKLPFPNPPEA